MEQQELLCRLCYLAIEVSLSFGYVVRSATDCELLEPRLGHELFC